LADDCPETIKLKTSTGYIWVVSLKKEYGKIFMDKRWSEFIKAHDLKIGYYSRSLTPDR
jgi:hypothetical protein